MLSLSIEETASASERDGRLRFLVRLTRPSGSHLLKVEWSVEAGTATPVPVQPGKPLADGDYIDHVRADGEPLFFLFSPGETEKHIGVDLIQDEVIEQVETVRVRIESATLVGNRLQTIPVEITNSLATGTIID